MVTFTVSDKTVLGRQTEHGVTTIQFPIRKYVEKHGAGGTFHLWHQRSTDEHMYPVVFTQDAEYLYWVPTATDTAYEGFGRAVLDYTFGTSGSAGYRKAVEEVFTTRVEGIPDATNVVPTPYTPWVTQVESFADRAEAAAEDAEESAEEAAAAAASCHGIPSGGTTGQVLKKNSNTDYDAHWEDEAGGSSDFDQLTNRPKYNGTAMTHETNIPQVKTSDWDGKYTKPAGGIPGTDLAESYYPASNPSGFTDDTVANSKYTKPASGIPKTDLADGVKASLDKADSALQSVPSTYRTAAEQDAIDSGKVDKITGKGLSTNDYTDADKTKVANAITEHQSLSAYRTASAQDTIDAAKVPTSRKVNGHALTGDVTIADTDIAHGQSTVGAALDTASTEIANLQSGKVSTNMTAEATTLAAGSSATASYNSATNKLTLGIPQGADGNYTKPSTGIPKTDLSTSLQTSIDKADDMACAVEVTQMTFSVTGRKVYVSSGKVQNWGDSTMKYGVAECVPGDVFIVNPFGEIGSGMLDNSCVIFADNEDNALANYQFSDFISYSSESGLTTIMDTVVAPSGTTKIYYNSPSAYVVATNSSIKKVTKWGAISNKAYRNEKEELTSSNVLNAVVYSYRFWGQTAYASSYVSKWYECKPFDKININVTIGTSDWFGAGVWIDKNGTPISMISPTYPQTSINVDVIAPSLAYGLVVCTPMIYVPIVSRYKEVGDKDVGSNKQYEVVVDSTTVTIANSEVRIKLSPVSANNWLELTEWNIGEHGYINGEDKFGPLYNVIAVNNPDGDLAPNFVGGGHTATGGIATSSHIATNVYCDGTLVTNGTYHCDSVCVEQVEQTVAKNTCKADGTGRKVLEARARRRFVGNKMIMFCTIKPLEDIKIEKYYGMQMAGYGSSGAVKVFYDNYGEDNVIGVINTRPDYFVLHDNSTCVAMKMYKEGLGNYTLNSSSEKGSVHQIESLYKKAYYHPIMDCTETFEAGKEYFYSGEYIFSNVECI